MQDRYKRKLRKLIRDPNLFFYDFFGKRTGRTAPGTEPGAEEEPLPRDFITDLSPAYERIVDALVQKTCPIQEMEGQYPHIRRLAVKESDLEYTLRAILEEDISPYTAVVERPEAKGGVTRIHFTDGQRTYHNPTIELDPWRRTGTLVQSRNRNGFVSSISVSDIQLTVCSPSPLYLAGDEARNLSFEHKLGLEASFTDHFTEPLDVVYTWVDSSDPGWRERKAAHLGRDAQAAESVDVSAVRYRTRDELRYSLRSIRSFLKQVRRIHIVTDSQVPPWLDTSHPLIRIVDHRDIFPEAAWLPTFNSHAIEANLHRVPGVAEHFLYFNDDVLLLNPVTALDFFHPNGIAKSFFEPFGHLYGEPQHDFAAFKNAALRGQALLRERYGKTAHIYHEHVVHACRRSVLESMWTDFPEPLARTAAARFRGQDDLSPISFFYHYYAIQHRESVPSQIAHAYVPLGRPGSGALLQRLLSDRETKIVCINDLPGVDAAAEAAVQTFFRSAYPAAAEWELDR